MWWIIVAVLLFSLVLYVLFAAFYVEIDTPRGIYRVGFHRFADMRILGEKGSVFVEWRIAFWTRRWDLMTIRTGKKAEQVPVRKKSRQIPLKKILAVVGSFRVTRCFVTMDTGNYAWNGMMFPVFFQVAYWSRQNISINFAGDNQLMLRIENTLARLLYAYFFK